MSAWLLQSEFARPDVGSEFVLPAARPLERAEQPAVRFAERLGVDCT
jgi:hypothetical protein